MLKKAEILGMLCTANLDQILEDEDCTLEQRERILEMKTKYRAKAQERFFGEPPSKADSLKFNEVVIKTAEAYLASI